MSGYDPYYIARISPLLNFHSYCMRTGMERTILDCGAGGKLTPLLFFTKEGYASFGFDISQRAIDNTIDLGRKNGVELDIREGDMRSLHFLDESMSFVYTYNTLFHLSEEDIQRTLSEMTRVLRPGGLLFVNLLSVEDASFGEGEEIGYNSFLNHDELNTFHRDDEVDILFEGFSMIRKTKRVDHYYEDGGRRAYIDVIARKNPSYM